MKARPEKGRRKDESKRKAAIEYPADSTGPGQALARPAPAVMSKEPDESGPITWQFIRRNFNTKERTRELLAPELERSLSLTDFERAVQFFPGTHRYWPVRSHFLKHGMLSEEH